MYDEWRPFIDEEDEGRLDYSLHSSNSSNGPRSLIVNSWLPICVILLNILISISRIWLRRMRISPCKSRRVSIQSVAVSGPVTNPAVLREKYMLSCSRTRHIWTIKRKRVLFTWWIRELGLRASVNLSRARFIVVA